MMPTTTIHESTLVSLAGEITREHEAASGAARSMLEHARRAGELLIGAKAHLAHGRWLPWLAEHCSTISEQQAQRYMRIARRWTEIESKSVTATDLTQREALALLAENVEVVEIPAARSGDWSARARLLDEAYAALEIDLAALKARQPATTIDEAVHPVHEATMLQARAIELQARSALEGRLLLHGADEQGFGDTVRLLVEHPELVPDFRARCEAHIAELQAAEVRR